MNVLLINPPYRYSKEISSGGINPALGLMYIASYCKNKKINVDLLDSIIESPRQINKLNDFYYRGLSFKQISDKIKEKQKLKGKIDLIGITNLFTSSYPIIKELVAYLKKEHNIPIVLGGANASALPEYVLKDSEVDFVVISEGEQSFVDLCNALKSKNQKMMYAGFKKIDGLAYKKNNKIYVNPKTKFIENLDKLLFPDRDFYSIEEYSKCKEAHGGTKLLWTTILSSRGCPFKCSFCTSNLWNRKFRARSAENVVDEIEFCYKKYGVREFLFEDENLTLQKQRIIEVCNEILKRNLKIRWQPANGIRASVTDKEVLRKMKESGCFYVVVAPESGSKRMLNIINKEQDLEKVTAVVRDALNLGFKVGAYFIIGFPGEKKKDVKKTIKYACKLARMGLHECVFGPFIPLPGSQLFENLVKKKKLVVNSLYFKQLFAAEDIFGRQKSWSEYISDEELKRLKIKGCLLFYMNKTIFHPFDTLRSIFNVLTEKHELKTEQALSTLLKKHLFRKHFYLALNK